MSMDTESVSHHVKRKPRVRRSVYQVTTYRQPYMTMPKTVLDKVFWGLYTFIVVAALLQMQWFVNSVSVFGATCVPLSLYVIPGYYYSQYYKGYDNRKYWSGLVFSIFGIGIMITYTALEVYSSAYLYENDM